MRARGFTLIELVVVIVLLGIVAVSFSVLISGSVGGYIDTARRADSASAARIALDRMGRELREAMPLSIRINNVPCIEFLPILGSSIYTNLPINTASFSVLDFSSAAIPLAAYAPVAAAPNYAAIYPVNSNQLYQLVAMRQVQSIGAAASSLRLVTLTSTSTYPRQSPAERVYFVGMPVSYCLTGGQLRRSVNAVAVTQPVPAANAGGLLLDNLIMANSSFSYALGNWRANGLVTINLAIQRNSSSGSPENLLLDHEVWIRNVQ